ncbi:MAG: hypothetical protein ACTSVC_14190 [Promethearchaeota archaeon]
MKKLKLYLGVLVLFISFLLPSLANAVIYNSETIVGQSYNVSTPNDEYTGLYNQDLTFYIYKINQEKKSYTVYNDQTMLIEGFGGNVTAPEWHTSVMRNEKSADQQLYYKSEIMHTNTKIDFPGYSTETYYQVSKNSSESLFFEHDAVPNWKGGGFEATAWAQMQDMTIGEISFDVMVHLNATNTRFYFSLDNTNNNSEMVKGYFDMYEISGVHHVIRAWVYPNGNSSDTLSDTPINFYNTSDNAFNWMHVTLFFDTWNDLYNITLQQYAQDWTYLDSPKSIVIRGDQNDGFHRTNTGARLSASHILNKIEFKLYSDAYYSISKAWVDNIKYRYYEFPAVYADVVYENATFGQDPNPKRWANKTIITSYESPQYPSVVPIAFGDNYFNNITMPGLIDGWELAPTWMYVFPFVVPTNNQTLIVNSLEYYINNKDVKLEERGASLKPSISSDYGLGIRGPLNSMNFTYNESASSDYKYYFDSLTSNYTIRIEYFDDLANMGVFKSFKMYIGDERSVGYVEFSVSQTIITPGYSTLALLGISFIMIFVLYKKQVLRISKS